VKNLLQKFLRIFFNKRAMSNAVSTLMTLTAAVALTGATVLVATNVSTNQLSNENVIVPTAHVWFINSTSSVGGIILTNSGQTDAIINKITINGANCLWNNQNDSFILYSKTVGPFSGDLPFDDIALPEQTITIGGEPFQFQAADQGVSLKSGSSMALYVATPNNIMVYSMGQPVTVVIKTTQAIYTAQANVESPS
jgi:hypothetical protein